MQASPLFTRCLQLALILTPVLLATPAYAAPQDQLFSAIQENSLPKLEAALADPKVRSAINEPDDGGIVALIYAAKKGRYAMAKALVEAGADIRAETRGGKSTLRAFDRAATEGAIDTMELLVERGYSIHETSSTGTHPLLLAVMGNNADAVEWFLSQAGQTEFAASTLRLAVTVAKRSDNQEILALLRPVVAEMPKDSSSDKAMANADRSIEVEGSRVTMRGNLSADVFETSTGELLSIAALDDSFVAIDDTTGRFMKVYGGMPLSDFMRLAIQSGIKPVLIEDNLFRIGSRPTGRYAFRENKLVGFVAGKAPSPVQSPAPSAAPTRAPPKTAPSPGEVVFTGDVMSLISNGESQPVIAADAPIFDTPPITKGAGFFRTAPGGFSQVFTGTLLAFENDIAEALVKNLARDMDATIRCRVSINTRGINYAFESAASLAEQLERAAWRKSDPNAKQKISSDTVRSWINQRVSIAAAGEECAHFESLD